MIIAYRNQIHLKSRIFYKNRFARIYPIYFLAIILMLISKLFENIRLDELFLNLTMLQSWFPGKALSINYPGWSLSVEFFFYVTFPLIFKYLMRYGLIKTSILIITFWGVSQAIFLLIINEIINIPLYSIDDINYNPFFHLNEFLIGNLTGLFYLKSMDKKNPLKIIIF
jgi:peptidoglycan/LPS O-acetylase OafA/YrhL